MFMIRNSILIKINFLNKLKAKKPDLIVITGDLVDVNTRDYNNAYKFINNLKEINPKIFFVNGNHEWKNKNTKIFNDELSKRGVKISNNTHEVFKNGNMEFNVCGIDDFHTKHHDLKKTFTNIDFNLFTILLSHSPKIITHKKSLKSDLILSGHTHGGQIRLPFIGAILSSGDGFFPKYDKGVFNLDNNTTLYVDSGLGTRLIPVRFLNRSQVSLININC